MGTQAPSLTGNHSRRGGRGPAATARPCAGLLPLTLALCPPGSKPSQNQAPCFHLGIPVSPCTTVFIFPETARRLRRELHARWPSASPPPAPPRPGRPFQQARPPLAFAPASASLGRPRPRLPGSKGPWQGSPHPSQAAASHRHPASLPFLPSWGSYHPWSTVNLCRRS